MQPFGFCQLKRFNSALSGRGTTQTRLFQIRSNKWWKQWLDALNISWKLHTKKKTGLRPGPRTFQRPVCQRLDHLSVKHLWKASISYYLNKNLLKNPDTCRKDCVLSMVSFTWSESIPTLWAWNISIFFEDPCASGPRENVAILVQWGWHIYVCRCVIGF